MFTFGLFIMIVSILMGVTTAFFAGLNAGSIITKVKPNKIHNRHFNLMVTLFTSVVLAFAGIAVMTLSFIM